MLANHVQFELHSALFSSDVAQLKAQVILTKQAGVGQN